MEETDREKLGENLQGRETNKPKTVKGLSVLGDINKFLIDYWSKVSFRL